MYILLFNVAGIAIVGWIFMIFAPGWSVTKRVAEHAWFPVFLALLYLIGIVPLMIGLGPGVMADFGNADGVMRLLTDGDVAMVVWIHILVFDHLVGVFVYRDNMMHKIVSMPVQSAILFLTLMFGPVGFLIYYSLRVMRGAGPAIGGPKSSSPA